MTATRRFLLSVINRWHQPREMFAHSSSQNFRNSFRLESFLAWRPRFMSNQSISVGLRSDQKSICSRSFFPCMDLSQVVYNIWTLKPVDDLRPANEKVFWVPAAGFTFEGHINNWTIYDLKEQFSKLAPWNTYLPTVHFLQQRIVLVLSDLHEQKT